MLEM
jgi:hypothetical protein